MKIGNSYSNYNNVNFGKFQDENARKEVRQALTETGKNAGVMQPCYDSWFNTIDKCDFFTAYTDKETGAIMGKFDDEFVKSEEAKPALYLIEMPQDFGTLKDMKRVKNAHFVADIIDDVKRVLNGEDLFAEIRRETPEERAKKAEENRRRDEERINWLLF